jgi:hypothetical protein
MAEKEREFTPFAGPIELADGWQPLAELSLPKPNLDSKTPDFRQLNKRALQLSAGALTRPNLEHFEFIKCFKGLNGSDTRERQYIPGNRNNKGWIDLQLLPVTELRALLKFFSNSLIIDRSGRRHLPAAEKKSTRKMAGVRTPRKTGLQLWHKAKTSREPYKPL